MHGAGCVLVASLSGFIVQQRRTLAAGQPCGARTQRREFYALLYTLAVDNAPPMGRPSSDITWPDGALPCIGCFHPCTAFSIVYRVRTCWTVDRASVFVNHVAIARGSSCTVLNDGRSSHDTRRMGRMWIHMGFIGLWFQVRPCHRCFMALSVTHVTW